MPDQLVIVWRVAVEHQAHPGYLEAGLYLGPDSLYGIEFSGVGEVLDGHYSVPLHELGGFLTVLDPAVVQEDHEIRRLAPLQQCEKELDEGITVY